MRNLLRPVVSVIGAMLLITPALAWSSPAGVLQEDLLVAEYGVPKPVDMGVSMQSLMAAMKPGEWEQGDDGALIYRINSTDQLTGQTSAIAMQFQPLQDGSGVLLTRCVVDQQEVPAIQLGEVFQPFIDKARTLEPPADLGKMAEGKLAKDILLNGRTSDAIRRIIPFDMYLLAKEFADQGTSFDAEDNGPYVTAMICLPHLCTEDEVDLVFDHSGHVWASITNDGKISYFGKPSDDVRKLLTRQ